jgi:DNA processing protein
MTEDRYRSEKTETDSNDSSLSRAYWLAWSRIDGIGATLLYRIQQHFGSLIRAWHAPIEDLQAISGFGGSLLGKIARDKPTIDPEALLKEYIVKNPNFWTPSDPEYPRLLLEIPSPPSLLHYSGSVEAEENNGIRCLVGIVGTREPTEYGKKWTHRFSTVLARHGITIVSGMAAGIDAIAHKACLEAGGRTIAVLGTGIDRIYPSENEALYREIKQKGLIVSEYAAGTLPDRRTFPARNRIIAGLCRAVIVTEAPKQSGALITVRYANEFGRDVYVLPASLDRPQSFGCLESIDKGAQIILGEEHLLEMLGTIPQLVTDSADISQKSTKSGIVSKISSIPSHLDPKSVLILQSFESIETESISFETIAQKTNLAASELSAALLQLEMMDLIEQVAGMRYKRL